MLIEKKEFGKTKDNNLVTEYILKNDNSFQVNILNYGGIIKNIYFPDKNGKVENVVLGYNNIEEYEVNSPYYGAIIGRTAGRIANAEFELDNKIYTLAKNNNENSIHGGINGFNKVLWDVEEIKEKDYIGLQLSYTSKDGEEGYPGNLKICVKYLITNNNRIEIFYEAVSDKTTLINLTNHSYFNLSGDLKENIYNHKIKINSSKVIEVDEYVMPTGNIIDVENTAFDLRELKKLDNQINHSEELKLWQGYDHPFILDKTKECAACVRHAASGRGMVAKSNQNSVVFYSGNQMEGQNAYERKNLPKHMGLCLEFQEVPGDTKKVVLSPGESYKNYSSYEFFNF